MSIQFGVMTPQGPRGVTFPWPDGEPNDEIGCCFHAQAAGVEGLRVTRITVSRGGDSWAGGPTVEEWVARGGVPARLGEPAMPAAELPKPGVWTFADIAAYWDRYAPTKRKPALKLVFLPDMRVQDFVTVLARARAATGDRRFFPAIRMAESAASQGAQ